MLYEMRTQPAKLRNQKPLQNARMLLNRAPRILRLNSSCPTRCESKR